MEIPNELLKIARMEEPKPATVKLLDTPIIDLQHPNPYPLPHTSKVVGTNQTKTIDSNLTVTGPYPGIVGTSTLSKTLKIKKGNLDIQDYLHTGDLAKQTPPLPKPSRKVIHSSAELQKILSPKCKGSGSKAKQTLFGSPRASASQMDSNEMLRFISCIKCEQMRKLDNLLKSKLPKNYADGIFQVVKALGYSIDTRDIGDINTISPDSFAQYMYLNLLTTIQIQVDHCSERCYADTCPCIV